MVERLLHKKCHSTTVDRIPTHPICRWVWNLPHHFHPYLIYVFCKYFMQNMCKAYFDQHLVCTAPKGLWKYTTSWDLEPRNTNIFFHKIFQTIRIYLPLVAGRFQRKRSLYPKISNILEISVCMGKNHCVGIWLGPLHQPSGEPSIYIPSTVNLE